MPPRRLRRSARRPSAALRGGSAAVGLPYPGSGYGSGSSSDAPRFWGAIAGGNPLGADRGPRQANYPLLAGRLDRCAVVAACLRWMTTNFVQARLQVTRPGAGGRDAPVPDSPFLKFMRSPCPRIAPGSERRIYSAEALWAVTILAHKTRGEAFWVKVRAGGPGGPVDGVKWVPDCHLRPVVPPGVVTDRYIVAYEYKVGTFTQLLPIEDVVHFRDGLDLEDQRRGWSALAAGLAQIVALNGGTATTAGLLTNMGIPPVVFMGTDTTPLDEPAARAIERRYNGETSGASAGRAIALAQPATIETIGLSPEDLALDRILQGPTAEICALLGLRPLAVGLSDDRGTYENEAQANAISWRDCLVPLQKAMAGTLQEQLYPDFGDPERETVAWDYSDVQSLKEDEAARIERSARAYEARMISFNQAAEAAGWEPRPGGENVFHGDAYPWSQPPEPEPEPEPEEDFEWQAPPEDDAEGVSGEEGEPEDPADPAAEAKSLGDDDLAGVDWDDPAMLDAMRAVGVDPDAADDDDDDDPAEPGDGDGDEDLDDDGATKAARSSSLRRDPKTGKQVSKRSKTGNPACSLAMSLWKTSGMTPGIATQLAACRKQAKQARQAAPAKPEGVGRSKVGTIEQRGGLAGSLREARAGARTPAARGDLLAQARAMRAAREGGVPRAVKPRPTPTPPPPPAAAAPKAKAKEKAKATTRAAARPRPPAPATKPAAPATGPATKPDTRPAAAAARPEPARTPERAAAARKVVAARGIADKGDAFEARQKLIVARRERITSEANALAKTMPDNHPLLGRVSREFDALDKAGGGDNWVPLDRFRARFPDVAPRELVAAIRKLRVQGKLSAETSEGRYVSLTRAQKRAAIYEAGSIYPYLTRRD